MWKVSKYGVCSGPYLDTFHVVIVAIKVPDFAHLNVSSFLGLPILLLLLLLFI